MSKLAERVDSALAEVAEPEQKFVGFVVAHIAEADYDDPPELSRSREKWQVSGKSKWSIDNQDQVVPFSGVEFSVHERGLLSDPKLISGCEIDFLVEALGQEETLFSVVFDEHVDGRVYGSTPFGIDRGRGDEDEIDAMSMEEANLYIDRLAKLERAGNLAYDGTFVGVHAVSGEAALTLP